MEFYENESVVAADTKATVGMHLSKEADLLSILALFSIFVAPTCCWEFAHDKSRVYSPPLDTACHPFHCMQKELSCRIYNVEIVVPPVCKRVTLQLASAWKYRKYSGEGNVINHVVICLSLRRAIRVFPLQC